MFAPSSNRKLILTDPEERLTLISRLIILEFRLQNWTFSTQIRSKSIEITFESVTRAIFNLSRLEQEFIGKYLIQAGFQIRSAYDQLNGTFVLHVK